MATSQQQWRHRNQLLLLAAALALVLLIVAGSADAMRCAPGHVDCDGKPYNGCETNVFDDPYNCGFCHHVCKPYPHAMTKCKNGHCTFVCNYLYGDCDGKPFNGCETNLSYDPYNCGYCHHVCQLSRDYKFGEVFCSGGQCKSRCKPGWRYNPVRKICYR